MENYPRSIPTGGKGGEKSKKGCLFGCLGTAIGVPLILVLVGYFLLMHSSLPLKMVANLLNEDKNITIEGIGGSISKGFTIDSLRASDGSGNESVFEGLTLQWGDIDRMRTKREVVIEKIGLESAHIYVDGSDSKTEAEIDSSEETTADSSSSGEPLNLFEIKEIDVRKVVIESKTGDFKLELDEFLMKGFRIKGDDFDLASLSVASNMLDIRLEDADSVEFDGKSIPFKRRVVGTVKSEMHKDLLRDIEFTIELGAMTGGVVTRVQAFDGKFQIVDLGEGREKSMTITDFTPADYSAPESAGAVKNLSVYVLSGEKDPATGKEAQQLQSGNFTLGTAEFTMAPQQISGKTDDSPSGTRPIIATTQRGGLEITATLTDKSAPPFFDLALSSEPTRNQREIISLLWFDTPLAELSEAQAAEAEKIETQHFSETE